MKKQENPSKILSHNLKNRLHNFNENIRRKSFIHNVPVHFDHQDHYDLVQHLSNLSAKSNHQIVTVIQPDHGSMKMKKINNDDSDSDSNIVHYQHQQLHDGQQIILQPQRLAIVKTNYQPSMTMIDDNHPIRNDDHYGSQKKLIRSELSLDKKGRKKKPILLRLLWLIFAIIGVITLLISQMILLSSESIVLSGFTKQLDVSDWSALLPAWKNVALDSEYYLFGIKNPNEFIRGSKPIIKEIGPYKYREFRRRKILEYKKDKVVFTERTHFQFKEQESRSMMETITVLNYPLLSIIYAVKATIKNLSLKFLDPIVQSIMSNVLAATGEKIVEQRTIYELLEGRSINFFRIVETISRPLRSVGIPIPDLGELGEGSGNKIRNQTFGFIWQRADVDIGPFEYWRRTENGHVFSHVFMVEGKTLFPDYRSPCDEIRGSDGMHFGTKIFHKNTIEIFNSQTCRALRFKRDPNPSNVSDIQTIRYDLDVHQIDMRIKNNRCFCLQNSLSKCDGWQDLSPCSSGIPLAISWPHFLNFPNRAKQLIGLQPDRERHSSYLNIEPNTGLTLEAKVSIQLGIKIDSTMPGLSSVPFMVFPIFWTTQRGGPNKDEMVQFNALVFLINFGNTLFGTITLATSIMFFCCSCYSFKRRHKTRPIS